MQPSGVMQRMRPGRPCAILAAWAIAWTTVFGWPTPAFAFDWNTNQLEIPAGSDTLRFKPNTASGDVSFNASECAFTVSGIICEGTGADAFEGRIILPNVSTADKDWTFPNVTGEVVLDTATQTLTNKTIDDASNVLMVDGASITTGTIPAARLGADFVDAMSDIDAAIKTSDSDTKLLTTSTANPGANRCLEINASGSVVHAASACAVSTAIKPVIDATPETKVNVGAAGTLYITPNGRITAGETDCRVPYPDGTYDNLVVLASAAIGSDVTVTIGEGACTGALTYAATLQAIVSGTANTRVTDTGALTLSSECMCVKVTTSTGMSTPAYLGITWERTA